MTPEQLEKGKRLTAKINILKEVLAKSNNTTKFDHLNFGMEA